MDNLFIANHLHNAGENRRDYFIQSIYVCMYLNRTDWCHQRTKYTLQYYACYIDNERRPYNTNNFDPSTEPCDTPRDTF